MRRLVGTNVMARHVAQMAPVGYSYAPGGFGFMPGRILPGPYTDTTTTVCLLPNDDGLWFKELAKKQGGTVREEE